MAAVGGANSGAELLASASDREHVALVFNPASGTQDTARRRSALESLARAAGLTGELGETDREHGAVLLARKAVAEGVQRLLVCGGDGSVTEAADALAGSEVALAVLPGGTGNLLAVNLGLPTDMQAAMRLALTGEVRPLDVGRANGRVFLIMAGMGLDAHMVRDADRKLKERLGVLAYLVAALRNLSRPANRYAITIDGRLFHRRAKTVLVANVGRITGGLELVPGADPEDGLLDVAILRAQGFWGLALLAVGTLFGRRPASRSLRGEALLEIHRGREIVIETAHPQPVQLDGNEVAPTARLEVHAEPGALRVIRPGVTEAGASLATAPVAALSRGAGIAWQLLAGAAAATVVYLRARTTRALDRRPGLVARHPFLVGLMVGAVTTFWKRRRTPSACSAADTALPEPPETASEEQSRD
jgi:YegS/Rv2252/BmrU family lipid kinase